MILISHRGNISGKIPKLENSPGYIDRAIQEGYDVEVDVWFKGGKWYLGHDEPEHLIDVSYLMNPRLWCHAKNLDALSEMLSYRSIRCFWHQEDDVTLTTDNYIWVYPGKPMTGRSICVMPESVGVSKGDPYLNGCVGICSDVIKSYK